MKSFANLFCVILVFSMLCNEEVAASRQIGRPCSPPCKFPEVCTYRDGESRCEHMMKRNKRRTWCPPTCWGNPECDCVNVGNDCICATSEKNPDMKDEKFNTRLGIYEENCGLENVVMSWGHDEYLYQVLKGNECHLPEEALYMIRFHSFYPWHTSGDYMHLCNNKDVEMMHWIREFNKFDLYTKCPDIPDVEELIPYYTKLIEKYVPGKLRW